MCYMIYFDNAATSFYKPKEVKEAVKNALNIFTANPGRSGHKMSNMVAEEVFNVREKVKEFFKAADYDIIFTKNCTEALNLAIFGTLKTGDHVIATCYEHNSVLRPLEKLKSEGVEVSIIDCDLKDFPQTLEANIKSNTKLIITTMVSNVTGDICDVEKVSKICKNKNIKYLIDGAQASGHIMIDLSKIDADFYAFAGHKGLLSIAGVGGLFVKDINALQPILFGGTGTNSIELIQPTDEIEGFETGTLPTVAILSLGAGIDFLNHNMKQIIQYEQELTTYLLNSIKNLNFINCYSSKDALNVISFNIKGFESSLVSNLLDEKFNICVRAGLHCAPLIHKKLKTSEIGAVRVSLDFNNTKDEIDFLIHALKSINNA